MWGRRGTALLVPVLLLLLIVLLFPTTLAQSRHGDTDNIAEQMSDMLTDVMAVLLHGSSQAQINAMQTLCQHAIRTGEAGPEQSALFRSALVAGGALPELVKMLKQDQSEKQFWAARALHALAIDDPETETDNFHSLEICNAGAVKPLVLLLQADDEQVQAAAMDSLSALAENPTCQQMISAAGAVSHLAKLATYGQDGVKLGALGALDILSVSNSPEVYDQFEDQGVPKLLRGISTMGSTLLREQAGSFRDRLAGAKGKDSPRLSDVEHAKAARTTRMKYVDLRRRAMQMMQEVEGRAQPKEDT